MSGINPDIFTAVCRLQVHFSDGLGNSKKIYGTGFWVKSDADNFFITNRHNIDPTLKLGSSTSFKLDKVYLQMRRMIGKSMLPEADFFRIEDVDRSVVVHSTSDVVAFKNPKIKCDGYGFNWFSKNEIADSDYLCKLVLPMDIASFIGYPGLKGKDWWDQQWQLGVARVVNIASNPAFSFTNPGIKTSDVALVSGLSFSGSSGSPVILHQKGFKATPPMQVMGYVEPKLIGIMSGHWWGEEDSENIFFHSGLSYFTRSTSILELL